MTQRVARPMKFAAFISIIISVAVMFAACQGAVGKAGDKGDKGDPGTTGTQGQPGINALLATNVAGTIRVNDKLGETAGTVAFGGTPEPFSVAGHFIGGAGDLAFKLKVAALDTEYFIVALAADGMVTLTVPTPARDLPDMDGEDLATFTVLVTDANNIEAEKVFSVKRNLAPNVEREVYPTIDNGVGTQNVDNPVNVDEDENNNDTARPKLNQYVITLDVGDDENPAGTDLGDAEPTLLTIMAESSDVTKATVAVDGHKVIITGVAATAAGEPVMVTIKAVDAGGLESGEITTSITVVAAPTAAEDTAIANQSVTQGTPVMVNAVAGFFTPAGLTYTATSSRTSVATVDAEIQNNLTVTTVNVGDTTITLKAADTLGQYVTREFTVNVKAP